MDKQDNDISVPAEDFRERWWSWRFVAELMVVFIIGVAVMQFIYSGSGYGTDQRASLAGNDCFFHARVAALLPETGLLDALPWLSQTIFRDEFTSHYYGFHVLLWPFVSVSEALTGDHIPGARWAMSVFFGLNLVAFTLILIGERVRSRWIWLVLFLMLPTDFFIRHSYVRALDLSLLCMMVGTFFLFRGRYLAAAVTLVVYTHIYLGSFFLVIIAGIHFISGLLDGPAVRFDWRLVLWIAVGATVGFVAHPYFPGTIDYLKTQIFGSGLTPEIPVGREWQAYSDVWTFGNMVGVPLTALAVSIALRLRIGPRLTRNEWTMLAAGFLFFVLVLKARRFIEYWPVFALLSSALVAEPVLDSISALWPSRGKKPIAAQVLLIVAMLIAGACLAVLLHRCYDRVPHMLAWWPVWIVLAGAYLSAFAMGQRRHPKITETSSSSVSRMVTPLVTTATMLLMLLSLGGIKFETVRRWAKGKYDVGEVQAAMNVLQANSEPGDIVFTDDWDVFPVYFYFNHHNYYILGLDPVFAYRHDPEMHARYVKISRGQVPCDTTVTVHEGDEEIRRTIHVELADIRDLFNARFVVVDEDHQPFARLLDDAPELCRRIHPEDDQESPPYSVYRILVDSGNTARGTNEKPRTLGD